MASYQKVQVWSKRDGALLLECSWSLVNIPPIENLWQSLDICFRGTPASNPTELFERSLDELYIIHFDHGGVPTKVLANSFRSLKVFHFFLQCLRAADAAGSGRGRIVKLIIPLQKGYIVRSDIIPLRLRDSQFVETAVSFAEPLDRYQGRMVAPSDIDHLPTLFSAATAGLILYQSFEHTTGAKFKALSLSLESDLENRLSFPWIQSGAVRRRTLVLVDANSAHPEEGLGLYLAAKALGINLVVLENAGHWLEEPAYSHWREAFIPTRLTNPPEEEVADHIVESIKAYGKPVDGVVTFADSFWPYIAQAASRVGLQTASPEALKTATNKYLTSVHAGHEAYCASSVDEALTLAKKAKLPYPLIIKPCDGWSSEGVSRVDSIDALESAVSSIDTSRHGFEFVMEEYCAGPEVDVNLVLLDGELLFFEVCDDLPKSADINGPNTGSLTNFHELNSVYPSALPPREIEVLRTSFLDSLLKLGLKNGVMHLEGRVEHSAVEYKAHKEVIDLCPRETDGAIVQQPTAWLIEINPRPLGMTGSQIIESTYGIDYWGLALLIAVGDKPRVRALSQPFKQGPQYTSVMVFIPADFPSSCKGIFDSEDICTDLKNRRPDLAEHISRCACLVKRGQKVPNPSSGRNSFLAYFNVFSRSGRAEALELAKQVREEVRYSFI